MNYSYAFVLVKPRLNPRRTDRFIQLGVGLNVRTKDRNQEIAERHASEAATFGRDGYRGNRTDATGQRQADSGTPVFGWKGAKHEAMTLVHIMVDLAVAGYTLTGVWLQQKEGDAMATLNMKFEPTSPNVQRVALSDAVMKEIEATLAQSWRHMHAFRNPNGSATVNPSHIVTQEEMQNVNDPRSLRLLVDGRFSNQSAPRTSTTTQRA